MMSGISLVSGTGNNTHPRQHIQIIDHITERGFPFVISQIRTHANADHRLLAEISCFSQDIRNPAHDIVFLVTGRIAGNPVEFTVAALSLLTFDHHKLGEGRHSGKIFFQHLISRCQSSQKCTMTVIVPGGKSGQRFLVRQGGIDLLFGILPAVLKIFRRISIPDRLVPNRINPCCIVRIDKYLMGKINAGIHNANKEILSVQVQIRLPANLQYPGRLQRLL